MSELTVALRGIVGPQGVFTDEETRERFSFDALGPGRLFDRPELMECRVDVVVRPSTTEQVSRVVRLANEQGVAVVPYGGGTGVMGAVVPVRGGIALDMRAMDRILELRPADRQARVQPGVVLADLDREAEKFGLMVGHDPWSVSIATVGGAISTDSVGYLASKYGSMGAQVLALEVVLADGSVVRTRPARTHGGLGLDRLFIGAEGAMGVITEATVELYPQPEERAFATVGFPSFEAGYPVVLRLFDLGLVPALVDLTEEEPAAGGHGFPCLLYLGFQSFAQEVAAQRERALAEGLAAGGVDLGPGPTEEYWEQRHESAERWREQTQPLRPTERWARGTWGRWSDYLHVSLPVSEVLTYHRSAQAMAAEHDLAIREAAVWTDPRLYSLFITDPRGEEPNRRAVLAGVVDRLLRMALEMGGGIEYCHGLGVKLDPLAPQEWGEALVLARLLKRSLDPRRTLNPDKLGL